MGLEKIIKKNRKYKDRPAFIKYEPCCQSYEKLPSSKYRTKYGPGGIFAQ
jgi:hypothetical protein